VKKATPPVSRTSTPASRPESPAPNKPTTAAQPTPRAVPVATRSGGAVKGGALGAKKTSILGTRKPATKIAAKKIVGDDIDFEAAEREALEEKKRIEQLGYNPNSDAKTSSTSATAGSAPASNKSSYDFEEPLPATLAASSTNSTVENTQKQFAKLGFGQTAAPKAPPKATTVKVDTYDASKSEIAQKFGQQKGISSDQFFGRNAYDSDAQTEAKERLRSFGGASAISSTSYFGRSEEEDDEIARGASGDYSVERMAQDVADRIRGVTGEDLSVLKDAFEQGASKLTDIMRDYLR
jgi:ADP-ribosylation factor GTPase-activating protein 2/3